MAQKLDKIHVFYAHKFCRPTAGVSVLKQSRYSALIESYWCTSEARKYKKRNHNDTHNHNDFLLSCNIGCKKHAADLALKPSRFS